MKEISESLLEFEGFRLDVERLVLTHDGKSVTMPLKEMQLLAILAVSFGRLVTKDELMDRLWSDAFVEEGNLSRHIYLLRKTLASFGASSRIIENVPKRGYRLSVEVRPVVDNEIIIEKYSVTETTIEESIEQQDEPHSRALIAGSKFRTLKTAAAVTVLVVIAGAILIAARSWQSSAANIRSIAVLPFKTIDDSGSNSHAGVGMTDILITRLSRLRELQVLSISAVLPFEDRAEDGGAVGSKLGVDAILEGTIFHTPDGVRVTMRLVRVSDDRPVWSGEFERPIADELKLQDEIALKVVDVLALNVDSHEKLNLTKHYTENRDAYEAYLRGRYFFDKRDAEAYKKAITEFKNAIALDGTYALAYAGSADVYAMQAIDDIPHRDELYSKAANAAKQALALDDELAEAHTSLAWIKRTHDWDWAGSEKEFRRALELNPNYYNAHMWYGLLLTTLGRTDEALAEERSAKQLAPLNTTVLGNYMTVCYFAGDLEELMATVEQIRNIGDDDGKIALAASSADLRRGDFRATVDIINDFAARHSGVLHDAMLSNLAVAYAKLGDKSDSDKALSRLTNMAKSATDSAYRLALAYADLGRNDEAIALLQRCVEAHDDRLMWLRVEPRFEHLRADPRFVSLLTKMGLSPPS